MSRAPYLVSTLLPCTGSMGSCLIGLEFYNCRPSIDRGYRNDRCFHIHSSVEVVTDSAVGCDLAPLFAPAAASGPCLLLPCQPPAAATDASSPSRWNILCRYSSICDQCNGKKLCEYR